MLCHACSAAPPGPCLRQTEPRGRRDEAVVLPALVEGASRTQGGAQAIHERVPRALGRPLARLGHTADYTHKEAFFEANADRRGDDVAVGTLDDVDLRWSIGWIPKTGEVIGTASNWLDAENPEHVPDYVFILGNAATEQDARSALARSHTLETLKDALLRLITRRSRWSGAPAGSWCSWRRRRARRRRREHPSPPRARPVTRT